MPVWATLLQLPVSLKLLILRFFFKTSAFSQRSSCGFEFFMRSVYFFLNWFLTEFR